MTNSSDVKLLTAGACAALGLLACGPRAQESTGCPEQDISAQVAAQVAAVRPALDADFVYFVTSGSPARLERAPRLGGDSELVLELDGSARVQALAVQNGQLVYLDGGRGGVFQASIGELRPRESALQLDQSISAGSTALAVADERVFWAHQTDDRGSAISSVSAGGVDPQLVAQLEEGNLERLVVTPDQIVASVLGSASPRVISVPRAGGAALTIAELSCSELELANGKLYCGSADSLYELRSAGEAPRLLLDVPHATTGAVADGAWYALVEWQSSQGGAALAKRTSATANTALLTCFQSSPRGIVVDQHDIYWLSAVGEAYSLRHLAR